MAEEVEYGVAADVDVAVAGAVEVGVAEADVVGVSVARGVAVGVTVGVGVGDDVGVAAAHRVRSVVQEAPSEGQQKLNVPHKDISPTLPIFEQLPSCGVSSAFGVEQSLSKSGCPRTGQASAAGQRACWAFSEIFCCCRTKRTPATTPNIKKITILIVTTIVRVLIFPDFLVVTV